jgi:hypothetical protein
MVMRCLCQERESGPAMSPGYCGTFKAVPVTLDDSLPEDVDVQILGRNHDLNVIQKLILSFYMVVRVNITSMKGLNWKPHCLRFLLFCF